MMRSVMIVASILGACSASTAVNAQTSDADFARAKEKLKAALKDQIVPTKSDAANNFSIADYDRFYELNLRMRPVADDLSAFIVHPPMPGGTTQAGIDAAVGTQDCMIRLAGNFDGIVAKLDSVGTLIGLAAKMVDNADLLLVTNLLSVEAPAFLERLKFHQQMLNSTLIKCSEDGATVAKGREISRMYSDAASLVQSTVEKIGASLQK